MRSYGLSLAYPRASIHLRHAVGELVWVVLGPLVHALHSAPEAFVLSISGTH